VWRHSDQLTEEILCRDRERWKREVDSGESAIWKKRGLPGEEAGENDLNAGVQKRSNLS